MAKRYTFLFVILLNLVYLNVLAQETDEKNIGTPQSFELNKFLWSYLSLQDDSKTLDSVDRQVQKWLVRMMRRRNICWHGFLKEKTLKTLMQSEDLRLRVERVINEEAKRKGRERVYTSSLAGGSVGAGFFALLFSYIGMRRSNYQSASCGLFSGAAALAAFASFGAFFLELVDQEDTKLPQSQEVIACLQKLSKDEDFVGDGLDED